MASDAPNALSLIGRTIGGRYTIKATIGAGGMGHVYRATQAPINREVAIKVLRVDLAHQEGVAERFKREAKAASLIQHPNAITIFDFDQDGEILYLAMELLSGETLRQRLRREPPLEINEALDMFESMAGALGAAHRVGVVHRDLKPDNIFLAKFDAVGQVVKVLDFGLAKLLDRAADNDGLVTEANLRLGTPRFMAPEQALGIRPIDSRCDVYALGLLLFEMLAQRAPFIGEDGMEVLAQRLRREAPRLSQVAPQKHFSEEMDELLASMLMRDREHRPQDANVVLSLVREIRKNNQVTRGTGGPGDARAQGSDHGRGGAFPRAAANAPAPYAPQPGGWPRSPVEGPAARSGPNRGEAMVRLDQDDFPEKPTVVVEPGMMEGPTLQPTAQPIPGLAAMGSMQGLQPVRSAPPGALGPGGPGESALPVQMYGGAAPPMGSAPPGMTGISSSGATAQVLPEKRTKLLIVIFLVVLAFLAPLIALLVRSAKNNAEERTDFPPPVEVVRPAPPPPPPPPPPPAEPEQKPSVDTGSEAALAEKAAKKGAAKKKASKGKSDSKKPDAKPAAEIF